MKVKTDQEKQLRISVDSDSESAYADQPHLDGAQRQERGNVTTPADMTRQEVITACERTAQRDNAMNDVAEVLLKLL